MLDDGAGARGARSGQEGAGFPAFDGNPYGYRGTKDRKLVVRVDRVTVEMWGMLRDEDGFNLSELVRNCVEREFERRELELPRVR